MSHRILLLNPSVDALLIRSKVQYVMIPDSFSRIVLAIATNSLLPVAAARVAQRRNAALASRALEAFAQMLLNASFNI